MTNRQLLFAAINAERDKQDARWGFPQHNTITEWVSILAEETGEVAMAVNDKDWGNLRVELIQVAAVCVSLLEHLALKDNQV